MHEPIARQRYPTNFTLNRYQLGVRARKFESLVLSSGNRPIQPLGNAATHDPFLVVRREKVELFSEQGHHLSIRAGEMREIRAPETALSTEGINDAANQRVKGRKRVGFVDVTRQC
jgi:hypothetical protein